MSNWITTKELDKASAKSPVGHHVTALSLLTNATLNRKLSQLAQLISFFHFVRSSHEHTYDNHGSSGRCVGPVRLRERFARGPPPDALSTTVLRALAGGAAGVGSSVGARSPGLAFGLAVNASNREKCLERTTVRDAQGRVMSLAERSWRERPAFSKRASRADAVLGGYSALRFDRATRERISQTDCVLPAGDEALPFMRARFPNGSVPGLGAVIATEFTGSFTCYWNQGANTLECGSVQCHSGSSLRLADLSILRQGATVSAESGSPSGWYTCDNGCRIFGFMDGTGGWDCEGSDEWGGGGSGGGGGGGGSGTGGGGNESDWSLGNESGAVDFEQPPSLAEEAEAWSKWAHEYFIDAAFKGNNCPRVLTLLKASSLESDLLYNGSSQGDVTRHAMRTPNTSAQASNQLIDQWIEAQIDESHSNLQSGNYSHGIWVLGRAIHAMVDRTSPAHTDALGNPRIWPIPAGEGNDHSPTTIQGRENVRDITPSLAQINRLQLISAMQSVFEGISPRPSCSAFN